MANFKASWSKWRLKKAADWQQGNQVWIFLRWYLGPADLLKHYLVGKLIVLDREACWSLITKYCILLSPWNEVCFIQSKANQTQSAANATCNDVNALSVQSTCPASWFRLLFLTQEISSYPIHPGDKQQHFIFHKTLKPPAFASYYKGKTHCEEWLQQRREPRQNCRNDVQKTSGSKGGRKRSRSL